MEDKVHEDELRKEFSKVQDERFRGERECSELLQELSRLQWE